MSEEELDDHESEKLITDSEVMCRTMAVIPKRPVQAQKVENIAMDYGSWSALDK